MNPITKQKAGNIDRFAQEKLGISTLVLMENAGRSTAETALEMLKDSRKVAIFCGKGNNGGDGFVATRRLLTKGVDVEVYLAAKYEEIKNEAKINLDILKMLGVSITEITDKESLVKIDFKKYSLVIDALFGVGLNAKIKGIVLDIISVINSSKIPVLSIDIPSGLDADTGEVLGICVVANKTITFPSIKTGMTEVNSHHYCGEIIACDIGFPLAFLGKFLE